jgi:hypothetical protein
MLAPIYAPVQLYADCAMAALGNATASAAAAIILPKVI